MPLAPIRESIPTSTSEQATHNSRVVAEISRIVNAATSESDIQALIDDAINITVLEKTTTYQILAADNGKCLVMNTSGGAFTVTLPAAADISAGWHIRIKDKGSATTNNGTIARNSHTIDGAASNITLSTNYAYRHLLYIGSGAFLIIGTI